MTSNMDDLIDAMARRHLASRRLDVCTSSQLFYKYPLLYSGSD